MAHSLKNTKLQELNWPWQILEEEGGRHREKKASVCLYLPAPYSGLERERCGQKEWGRYFCASSPENPGNRSPPLHRPGLGHSTVKWVVHGLAEEHSFPERPSNPFCHGVGATRSLPPPPIQEGQGDSMAEADRPASTRRL